MRKPKDILDKKLYTFFMMYGMKTSDKSIPYIVQAMQEYAEEYHHTMLLKLNKSDVINSLDLNELKRKLDEALASETSESLNEWLNEKRQ